MKRVEINSSLMHILKARLRQKLGFISTDEVPLKIIETGKKDGYPYVRLNNNQIFFHRFSKSPLIEILTSQGFSVYVGVQNRIFAIKK